METEEDYGEHVQAAPETKMKELAELVDAHLAAETHVAALEVQLYEAKRILTRIAEVQLPELLEALQLAEFKTTTGLKVTLTEVVRASLPKGAPRLAALSWLRENNYGALIKRSITVEFGKGEDENAQELIETLKKDGLEPSEETTVHPQTLAAFVREKLAAGETIPLELFGVFRQRVAKVKKVK